MFNKNVTLMNSKSTTISENWLTLFDIHCIITVTYCKFAVHLLYRATVSHCTNPTSILPPIYATLRGPDKHCTPLYRTPVLHWTALYLPTDQHCTAIYETVWGTDQHFTPLYTSIKGTDQHSGTVTHCTYVFYPI